MKKLLIGILTLGTVSAYATEIQLQECKFGNTQMVFTPSAALTKLLKNEVKGSVVYKVQYRVGPLVVGPKTDLAVVDELPSKTLAVSFFDHDEEDGVNYLKTRVSIDLKSPIGIDAPVVIFESELNDELNTEGTCSLSL